METKNKDYNHGLVRGLKVILAFNKNNLKLTNADISARTEESRAAVRRTLLTLVDLGYMVQIERRYQLTPKVLDIGFSCLSSLNIGERVQLILNKITDETHESCALGFPDNTEIRYVATSTAKHRKIPLTLSIGTTIPIAQTAIGEAYLSQLDNEERNKIISTLELTDKSDLMAELDKFKRLGYAISEGGYETGINAIAIPIQNNNGKVVASLGLIANGIRAPKEVLVDDFLAVLTTYSGEISRALF